MKHIKRWVVLCLTVLFFLLFGVYLFGLLYTDTRQTQKIPANISVVVYGESSDRWKYLEQGIGQACNDLGIEKPAITVAYADDPLRQIQLLRREAGNGTQGFIIAAADQAVLREQIEQLSLPVVFVESGIGDACVGADNAQMGRELAERLAGSGGNIAVLAEGLSRQSVEERFEAFMAEMARQGKQVIILERENQQDDLKSYIASSLAKLSIDALAVLDTDFLETAIDAVPVSMSQVRLYGIGIGNKAFYALDQGIVEELIVENEFAMGYIATLTLAEKMGYAKSVPEASIQYITVTRETMYDPEMERLLYPIFQ